MTYHIGDVELASSNITIPIMVIPKPKVVNNLVLTVSENRPATADTMALTSPPGSITTPVKATGIANPFCQNIGKRYMDERMIAKSSITRTEPTVNWLFLKTLKFKMGVSETN